jgi:hypothetical protein
MSLSANEFASVVKSFFERRLKTAAHLLREGELVAEAPVSFPTNLRVAESTNHYIGELVGAKDVRFPEGYAIAVPRTPERVTSTNAFVIPGFQVTDNQTAGIVLSHNNSIDFATFATLHDKEAFQRKFGFQLQGSRLETTGDLELPITIPPEANFLLFLGVNLVRVENHRVLYRAISTMVIIRKETKRTDLVRWLDTQGKTSDMLYGPLTLGLNGYPASNERFARELASLADQNITEPVIDDFIQKHDYQFAQALGYHSAVSQLELQWVDRHAQDPMISKPDYLMQRTDGYYDILDLKKAALQYSSITRGGDRNRYSFIAYVVVV